MGTNYYLQEGTCPHCGRGADRLHIGKSSAGWCFGLHVMPEIELNTLDDWRVRWKKPGAKIFNEYGDEVSVSEMEKKILERQWHGSTLGPAWYDLNSAEPGPNKLARHAIGRHCVGHGDGTYDLITGEFS